MSLFPQNPEQRYYPRLDLSIPVAFLFNQSQVVGKTHDLSCGGVYIAGHQKDLPIGQQLTVRLYVPEIDKTLKFNGTVCRHESVSEKKPLGVAVKFEGLYDDNFLEVDRYVKWRLSQSNPENKI